MLSTFLPPPITENEIDRILCEAITQLQFPADEDPRKSLGRILKNFYSQVDKAAADPALVKRRAQEMWSKSCPK